MKFLVVLLSFLYLLQQRVVSGLNFNRIAFFPVCRQLDPTCNTDNVTNAEILSVSTDGLTVIYGDSESGAVGFVDIADPYNPAPLGFVDVGGEPTSLGVTGDYVVVAVNTSPDFVNVSGVLYIINIDTQEVLRTMDLEGQPDSVAISPDQRFVAIAIENERNEDLEDGGGLPQLPAGFLNILVTESDDVMEWELSKVELTGLDGPVEPDDPEPEYVDINDDNICVLTLQENNGIVLIDLEDQAVISSFTAGTVDLTNIDVIENDVIYQNSSATLSDLPREPDGVTWISTENFVTSDEGDWLGGTRGFTVYDKEGNIVYTSAEELETLAIKYGHYPEGRAENKGKLSCSCRSSISAVNNTRDSPERLLRKRQ